MLAVMRASFLISVVYSHSRCPNPIFTFLSLRLSLLPELDLLHAALLLERLVKIERVEEQVGLVAHALAETLPLGLLEVGLEDGLVDRVSALVNDDTGSLPGAQSSNIGETLLGNNDIQVVLGLVDVCAHGDDAADSVGVGLAGSGRRGVHDAVLGVAEEIGRTAETVEHAAAHHAGRVGVGVDIDLDGRVHANDTETTDDLGRVADLLGAEEKLVIVVLPVVVEALEPSRREADRCRRGEIKTARVEQVEEGVLDDFSPDLEVAEVGVVETTNDSVGNVTNAGLERQEAGWQAAVLDLVLEELDQMARNLLGALIRRGVGRGLILVVGLDDTDNLLGVNWDRSGSDAVFDAHDEVGLAPGWQVGHGNIVEPVEAGQGSVDLDDDLGRMSVQLTCSQFRI